MKQDRITARIAAPSLAPTAFASIKRPASGADAVGSAPDLPSPSPETAFGSRPGPTGKAPAEHDPASHGDAPRDLWRALRRGWRQTCPACGGGPVFGRYLSVRERCVSCGERLDCHTADDAPTWLTIMVVGHLVTPLMLLVWGTWNPPLWVHWTLWPPLTLLLTLALLPRFKAMVVALQWAKRMAGFDDAAARD